MSRRTLRYPVLAAGLLAISAPVVSRVYAHEMKCYFKDCVVFPDGSRFCEVKEIPCPKEQ